MALKNRKSAVVESRGDGNSAENLRDRSSNEDDAATAASASQTGKEALSALRNTLSAGKPKGAANPQLPRGGGASTGFKTVIPFVIYCLIVVAVLTMYETCNIHHPKRKDCGYPGITVTECYTYGRWQATRDGPKMMMRCLSGWLVLAASMWFISGYDIQGMFIYFLLALAAAYHQTACCYDGHVPAGVPHCYC